MLLGIRTLTGTENFISKFVRVGNEIFITKQNDTKTLHLDLAKQDKILDRVKELKSQNSDLLDGGIIFISGRIIRIGSASTSLGLPITEKARKLTIKVLKNEYPSFSIKEVSEE